MVKPVRNLLVVISIVQVFFAIAFMQQWGFATGLWPFEGTTPLTFFLVASIFAAAAASTLWAALSGNFGALAGIGMDYITILAAMMVICFMGGAVGFGLVCAIGVAFGVWLLTWSRRHPIDASIPVPGFVRGSFIVFVIALLIVGGLLLAGRPNTIPWMITRQLSNVIGWMFLGAAVYFFYGIIRPSWANAAGQLVGFLAYDLVLIGPFLARMGTVPAEQRTGQVVYLIVVIYSGLLAAYYLLFNRSTRLFSRITPANAR